MAVSYIREMAASPLPTIDFQHLKKITFSYLDLLLVFDLYELHISVCNDVCLSIWLAACLAIHLLCSQSVHESVLNGKTYVGTDITHKLFNQILSYIIGFYQYR